MLKFRPRHAVVAVVLVLFYRFRQSLFVITNDVATPIDYGMFEWVNSAKNGHCSHKQEVRHVIPNDPQSPLGVFATEHIGKGEVLCNVPEYGLSKQGHSISFMVWSKMGIAKGSVKFSMAT